VLGLRGVFDFFGGATKRMLIATVTRCAFNGKTCVGTLLKLGGLLRRNLVPDILRRSVALGTSKSNVHG
jgi:hypothetical protein